MKKSEGDRLKYAVYESTRVPLARSLPVSSFRAKARNLFRSQSSRRCGDSGIPDTKPSPRGEGAPKGRIGQERYERERGKIVSSGRYTAAPYPPLARSPFPDGEGKEEAAPPHLLEDRLKSRIYGSTLSTAGAVPLPQGGRLRNENTAIPETKPSPLGEGAPKGRIGQVHLSTKIGHETKKIRHKN